MINTNDYIINSKDLAELRQDFYFETTAVSGYDGSEVKIKILIRDVKANKDVVENISLDNFEIEINRVLNELLSTKDTIKSTTICVHELIELSREYKVFYITIGIEPISIAAPIIGCDNIVQNKYVMGFDAFSLGYNKERFSEPLKTITIDA